MLFADCFIKRNSADPGKISHSVSAHLGLLCLQSRRMLLLQSFYF